MAKILEILVLRDPKRGGRHNNWKNHTIAIAKSYQDVSISEQVTAAKPFIQELRHHLIILNWDCANGDSACGSDYTLDYMRTQAQPRIQTMMHTGRILWVDVQSVKGYPVQEAYDAVFGLGQLTVMSDASVDEDLLGHEVCVTRFSDHPLIRGLSSFKAVRRDKTVDRPFYGLAFDMAAEDEHYNRKPGALWSGWFTGWAPGWLPLLEPVSAAAAPGKTAVLLVKVQGTGLLVATTMRTAEACFSDLTNRLGDEMFLPAVRAYHAGRLRKRRYEAEALYALLVAAFFAIAGMWWYHPVESRMLDFALFVSGASVLGLATYANGMVKAWINRPFRGTSISMRILRFARRMATKST